jgi:type IV fimbrial biogenesis protein FimT
MLLLLKEDVIMGGSKLRGVTLIELVVVLAVVSVLFGSMAPSFSKLLARNRATTSINWIITAVNFTRHAAVINRNTMTLCAPKTETKCGGKWHEGLIVFSDRNKNARIDGKDEIIAHIPAQNKYGTIKWRAFRNRQYLQMTQMGYTNFQNENFVYCPRDQNRKFARQLVINVQGRARVVHSRNKEGYPIDRHGKLLRC